jgi:hypothetical protein
LAVTPAAHGPGVDEALDRINLDTQRLAAESYSVELTVRDVASNRSRRDGERVGSVANRDEPAGDGGSHGDFLVRGGLQSSALTPPRQRSGREWPETMADLSSLAAAERRDLSD